MQVCPECDAECPDGATACDECGTALGDGGATTPLADAGFDPEEAAEQFERRYGIDIGDRTVDEFLRYLERQDFSRTYWFWLVVVAQGVGVTLFALSVSLLNFDTPTFLAVFSTVSVALALSILGDTRAVGQFDPWTRIRWAYILLSLVPLVGHITGFLYLVLRRLQYERTVKYRQRLLDAGFDLEVDGGDR